MRVLKELLWWVHKIGIKHYAFKLFGIGRKSKLDKMTDRICGTVGSLRGEIIPLKKSIRNIELESRELEKARTINDDLDSLADDNANLRDEICSLRGEITRLTEFQQYDAGIAQYAYFTCIDGPLAGESREIISTKKYHRLSDRSWPDPKTFDYLLENKVLRYRDKKLKCDQQVTYFRCVDGPLAGKHHGVVDGQKHVIIREHVGRNSLLHTYRLEHGALYYGN